LLPYILFEKYIYILALKMASPGNQHCANCIGALAFPIGRIPQTNLKPLQSQYGRRFRIPHLRTADNVSGYCRRSASL